MQSASQDISPSLMPFSQKNLVTKRIYTHPSNLKSDKDFGKFFLDWLFDRFRKALGSQQELKEENSRQPK